MFMDPEVTYFLLEKTKKQEYLKQEVVDLGYDTVEFAQFIEAKRGKIFFNTHHYILHSIFVFSSSFTEYSYYNPCEYS